jgi:hypothetical protein
MGTKPRETLRVAGQHALKTQHRICERHQHDVEHEHVDRIAAPALLLLRIDAAELVEAGLDGAENGVDRRAAAFVQGEQPQADGFGQRQQDADEAQDEDPSFECHEDALLKAFGTDEHRHEVKQQPERDDRGEPEVEGHDCVLIGSGVVAQADIGERRRHQSDHERYPE